MASQTSLTGALGAKFPDTTVLFDDRFDTPGELHSWRSLYSGEMQGVIGWDRGGMVLAVENNASQISTAIKRLTYWDRFTTIRVEMWCAITPWYTSATNGNPKMQYVAVGFDQADNAGNRSYLAMRRKFLESDGTTETNRYEIKTGTGAVPSWTPLPRQGYPVTAITGADPAPTYDGSTPQASVWPPNEGKRNQVYFAMEANPVTGLYSGARFNDTTWGSMRPSGDSNAAELAAIGGQTNTLTRFANGLNVSIDLAAISAGSKTGGTLTVYRVRATGVK